MPILDGFELIEETRRLGNHSTLFVISSGYDDFDYAKRAMRLGVKEYLTKPVVGLDIDEVLERVHKELHERERRELIRESADRYAIRQALSTLLFGVSATDVVTYLLLAVVLGAVALVATWVPARRAAGVPSIVALRQE